MSDDNYSKAPLSEVIFGITLKQPILEKNGYIFELINTFKKNYPVVECILPIADEILTNFSLAADINYKLTGPILYRLNSTDFHWLVQLQFNKFFFNWIRKDADFVGNYPGFTKIYSKFSDIEKQIQTKVNCVLPVKFYELTYQDRIFWQEHITDLSEIDKILRIKLPIVKTTNLKYSPNNIFSKYTIPIDKINGFGLVSIDTATSKDNKQVISFQCTLRGYKEDLFTDDWYKIAHDIQIDLFKDLFNENLLKSWK